MKASLLSARWMACPLPHLWKKGGGGDGGGGGEEKEGGGRGEEEGGGDDAVRLCRVKSGCPHHRRGGPLDLKFTGLFIPVIL